MTLCIYNAYMHYKCADRQSIFISNEEKNGTCNLDCVKTVWSPSILQNTIKVCAKTHIQPVKNGTVHLAGKLCTLHVQTLTSLSAKKIAHTKDYKLLRTYMCNHVWDYEMPQWTSHGNSSHVTCLEHTKGLITQKQTEVQIYYGTIIEDFRVCIAYVSHSSGYIWYNK